MKRKRSSVGLWAAVGAVGLWLIGQPQPAKSQASDVLELPALIASVERAIFEAKEVSAVAPFFIIQKVDLKLQGETKADVNGKVSFSIPVFNKGVDLGAKGNRVMREKLEITLLVPPRTLVGGDRLIDLVPLITSLKDTFRQANSARTGMFGGQIRYTKSWTLQLSGEGKVNLIVAGAGVSVSDEKTQEIIFHLCQTSNLMDCVQ